MKQIMLLIMATFVFAQTDPVIEYKCNAGKGIIVFSFGRIDTADEREATETNDKTNFWKLRDLRTIGQSEENGHYKAWVENSKIIKRECITAYGTYKIEIGEQSGNPSNLYGRCGGWLTGYAKIKKNQKILVDILFENSCNADGLITSIEFDTAKDKVTKKTFVKYVDYY